VTPVRLDSPDPARGGPSTGKRMLITAGPTHEPIDAVRFLGNRSSGRLGVALADEAAARGWDVTLLLGPVSRTPSDSRVRTLRFRTCADLETLLRQTTDTCDVLVMAAAVADLLRAARDAAASVKAAPRDLGSASFPF